MGQAADFFVSYTSTDRAWAEWIAWQLEAEGYQVMIQAWDLRPGSDFVQQMHQLVQEAERTIAVLSPAYLNSAFGGAGWGAVFAKGPTGERELLLPGRAGGAVVAVVRDWLEHHQRWLLGTGQRRGPTNGGRPAPPRRNRPCRGHLPHRGRLGAAGIGGYALGSWARSDLPDGEP
jgi:hypothetical protein